MHNSWK